MRIENLFGKKVTFVRKEGVTVTKLLRVAYECKPENLKFGEMSMNDSPNKSKMILIGRKADIMTFLTQFKEKSKDIITDLDF